VNVSDSYDLARVYDSRGQEIDLRSVRVFCGEILLLDRVVVCGLKMCGM